ncbi:MAG: DEAD/DEAH box helicase [Planctomycetes bacterium]|nr:DEAD/DEAH box helicase [Planctomycetota bacterium]
MTLADLYENEFRGDVRFRGEAFLEAERVSVIDVATDRFVASVRDGEDYEARLVREGERLQMSCTCAAGQRPEPRCRHLWAAIIAVDAGNYLTASPRAGHLPSFVHDIEDPLPETDWLDDLDELSFSDEAIQVAVRPRPPVRRLREWEARLEDVKKSLAPAAAPAEPPHRERRIFYEIDVAESRRERQLVIETVQQQRRTSGQWGKPKPLKLRSGRVEDIDHDDDRRILAWLAGATPVRASWQAQQLEGQAGMHRYRLSHELAVMLLPAMCETGRVRLAPESDAKAGPTVAWDDGPPWELAMALEEDESGQRWRLEGRLRRGDDLLPLETARLVLPGGLVVTSSHVARLRDFDAFAWMDFLEARRTIEAPKREGAELVDRLLAMPAIPRLDLPDELRLEEVKCEPTPHLMLVSPGAARWHMERLRGAVSFDYLGTLVAGRSPQWAIVQREAGRCIPRHREAEERAWAQLEELGFRRLLDRRHDQGDVEISAKALGTAVRALIDRGWQVRAEGKDVRQAGELRFRVESAIDWFELHADVDFGGHRAPFPELLSALARGDSAIRLDDGSLGILPEDWVRRIGIFAGLGIREQEHLRFAANQAALLDALLAAQPEVNYDGAFQKLRDRFQSPDVLEPAEEPQGFHGHLRGYQREGLSWLRFLSEVELGGCLADDMGLGKTVQLLALLLDRKLARKKTVPSLIVVPRSLMFNWRQESERFTPQLGVLEYAGPDRAALVKEFKRHDIVLTTYGTLRRDAVALKDVAFDYVVLDEAQTIKNAGSQVARAARLLNAAHRLALSGTPIENHLGDLWSIFEFLNPGMLGRSSVFRATATDGGDGETRGALARGLRPFILRRTKAQVAAELPEKTEQTIYCDMNSEQRRLYDELRDHYRQSLLGLVAGQGLARSKMHVLEALLRLRQAACHPGLLKPEMTEELGAKLRVLVPHLEEVLDEGHKVLVFSQFTSMLAIVREHLDRQRIVYEYLDGRTRDRKARVERFQSDEGCGVFLISLKAGGLGLNLTAADYVFLLDPWWNPAAEAQAIDRAHRVGQTRPVHAYRLICRDTVEERIAELQTSKRELAEAILEADNRLLKDLTLEDLERLLS